MHKGNNWGNSLANLRTMEKRKKKKDTVFEGIMQGAREALAYVRGEANETLYQVHVPDKTGSRLVLKEPNP